ncbi:MAG: hypothetical protein LBT97_13825, partial [Planctomycetota bacterium]|nr:hypothetical protein [Planctomycetota bacterium]
MLKAPNSPGGPLARYNALNVPDQTVFQALSILYEPASAVVVTAVLNGAGLRESPLRSFTPQNVLLRLRRLDQAGLADAAAGGETGREAARLLWKARPREAELALRHAVRDGAFAALARSALSAARGRDWRDEGAGRSARRNLRLAFHGGDWDAARRECLLLGAERGGAGGEFLSALIDAQPDELWMRRGSPAALAGLAESALRDVFSGLGDPRTLVGTMGKLAADHPALALGLARAAFLRGGEADWAGAVFAETGARIRLLAAFRSGDDRLALECAGLALAERRRGGGRDATLDGLEGVAQVLAAIRSGGRGGLERAVNNLLAPAAQSHEYAGALRALRHAALHFLGQSFPARTLPALAGELPQGGHPLTVFIHGLASWWIDPARLEALCPALRALAGRADAGGWRWLAAQLDGLAAKASAGGAGAPPWPLLADAFPEQEEWRRSLGALAELARDGGDPEAQKRLAWLVGGDGWGGGAEVFSLQPVEQTRGKDGTWTRGRNIALRKVFHHPEMFPHAGDRDRLVFSALRYAEADGFHFEPGLALESLVGHPLVFRDDASGARIDVERGVFELTALDRDGGCDIALEPPLADFPPAAGGGAPDRDLPPVLARFESPCRLRVYKLDQRSRRLTMVVGPGLSIPAPGREDALRALGLLAGKVHVHSDLPELAAGGARVEADPRPRFHLLPRRPGLDVELWAHPLGDDGPAYRPGRGGRILAAGSGDGAVAALRDLDREKTLAAGAAGACPSLAGREAGDWSWRLEDPEVCLAFLAEAGALGERAVLAWPRGGRFRVRRVRGAGDLSLRLAGGGNDWLGLDGALRVDENLVVGMADLLAALGRSSGRFVEIGDGEYIALTEELARQLRDLEALTRRRDGELALSSLAAAAVEGFAELGADVRADRAWRETLARREALDAFSPGPPDGFGAELRDYQLAGYRWLARLAEWGAGACLADDMGLGKTIQALAVLVRRAELGPALVVAPTSVCHNWIAETRRFAPALRPVAFGEGDRERTLSRLGPGDL